MRVFLAGAAALALTFAACSQQSPPLKRVAVVRDLVAELPSAELHREIGAIDFGTPAARPSLGEGWYGNEGGGRQGPTVVWSRGRRSEVNLWLATPRDLRAEVRCAPYDPLDGKPQVVTVELNGQRIGELTLRPKLGDYSIELPKSAQLPGRNQLTFRYRKVTRTDRRHLAVSWDTLRLSPGSPAGSMDGGLPRAAERAASQAPALLLPFGTEAGYYFDLEEGGTLSLQGIRGQGDGAGELQVIAQEDGGRERVLETLAAGSGPRTIEIPGRGERLVRLALRAVPASIGTAGGFVVLGPAVRAIGHARDEATARAKPPAERPNVIIYLVDTLRADHVGVFGGGELTPNVDAFAEGATVFRNTVAQAPWTKPSVVSIFTGLGPLAHGVQLLDDRLPQEALTAAEMLHASGYRTAGFSTNWHVRGETGLDQGFVFFDFKPDEAASDLLNGRVLRWLDGPRQKEKGPFFLYVHALDPHAPYTPPADYRKRYAPEVRQEAGYDFDLKRAYLARGKQRREYMAEMSQLYDGEVAFNDHSFGEFVKALRRRGLYDDSLIVFVSDHGEEFDEHGDFGHARNLYNETLNIPLIVKWPGQRRGQVVESLAQHIDLLPTLLRAAGASMPQGLPGMDLALIAASEDGPEALTGRRAFSHLNHRGREGVSVVHAGWKLIHPLTRDLAVSPQLHDRARDQREITNRATDLPVRSGFLGSLIRAEMERSRGGLKAESFRIDPETRKALEALGYL
jgi:choline-sulfatase